MRIIVLIIVSWIITLLGALTVFAEDFTLHRSGDWEVVYHSPDAVASGEWCSARVWDRDMTMSLAVSVWGERVDLLLYDAGVDWNNTNGNVDGWVDNLPSWKLYAEAENRLAAMQMPEAFFFQLSNGDWAYIDTDRNGEWDYKFSLKGADKAFIALADCMTKTRSHSG